MRDAANGAFGHGPFAASSFGALEELTRKNLAAFTQALGLFSPFVAGPAQVQAPRETNAHSDIDELRTQLSDMKRRLDDLTEKS
jgi:polyhydroxyalkanoate synthesis regulator protein